MATPFYVSPEQWYQDKAEYARKGIARGKPIVAIDYGGGIALMAENPSASLQKISEIYDRIAFAGVGKFDEYENLRKSGVRYADLRGYSYCREDVAAKNLDVVQVNDATVVAQQTQGNIGEKSDIDSRERMSEIRCDLHQSGRYRHIATITARLYTCSVRERRINTPQRQ